MISVVIPVYNEEKLIGSCLESLVRQKGAPKFEVIIVNNNSTDETVKLTKIFKKKLNLKIILEKHQGRGAARATGFKSAQGEIILSTDADTTAPDNWIVKIYNYLKGDDLVAITGNNYITDCPKVSRTIYNTFFPPFMKIYGLVFGNVGLNGFNFGIKKAVYARSGGFNRNLDSQEDWDLAFRVANFGKIKFASDLTVYSSGRRYRNGLIIGLFQPLRNFIFFFLLGKKQIFLENIR